MPPSESRVRATLPERPSGGVSLPCRALPRAACDAATRPVWKCRGCRRSGSGDVRAGLLLSQHVAKPEAFLSVADRRCRSRRERASFGHRVVAGPSLRNTLMQWNRSARTPEPRPAIATQNSPGRSMRCPRSIDRSLCSAFTGARNCSHRFSPQSSTFRWERSRKGFPRAYGLPPRTARRRPCSEKIEKAR